MRLVDDATLDRVYHASVRDALFAGAVPAATACVVIVGGQPGAGKTAATLVARRELAGAGEGVAYINGDELRPYHPHYEQLLAADKSTAADRTSEDVGLWVERGIREAAAAKFHAVIETTMRQPAVVARTAAMFAGAGHVVELRVLVVDPELSRLGIYQRFARSLDQSESAPRFTLARYHEEALARMPDTLDAAAPHVNVVRFVDRRGAELHEPVPATDASAVLGRLRGAPAQAIDVAMLAREWERLRGRLDREGVPTLVREGVRAEQARHSRSGPDEALQR